MRQVGSDELSYKIVNALRRVPRSIWKAATDTRVEVNQPAIAMIADTAAKGLADLEVLSSAPAAPDALFSRPMARMRGEDVGNDAMVIE